MMRPPAFSFKDFRRLIRWPNLLMIVLTQWLTRLFLVGPRPKGFAPEEWAQSDWSFWMLSLSTIMIAAAGYIINDYYDVKIDSINKPDRVVIGIRMQRRVALLIHLLLNLSGIGIGFLLSFKVGVLNFFVTFWLWIYSNQLKRLPFWGNLSIACLTGLSVYVVGLLYSESWVLTRYPMIVVFALFAFFISLIREIIKDMEDIRGDMHFGCRTLPIVWGIRRTKTVIYTILCIFMGVTAVLVLMIRNQWLFYYFAAMLLPAAYFIYALYWADTKASYRALSQFCKVIMLSGIMAILLI